jgi:hypothetical protein
MDEDNGSVDVNQDYELQNETELRVECGEGESVLLRVSARHGACMAPYDGL